MSILHDTWNKFYDKFVSPIKLRRKTKRERGYKLATKVTKSRKRLESFYSDLAEKGPGVLYHPYTLKEFKIIINDLKTVESILSDLGIR